MNIKEQFNKTKEEMLIGGFAGAVMYWVYSRFNNIGQLESIALQSQGLIDIIASSTPITKLATYKILILFITIGIILGYFIGDKWNPVKWGK